MREIQMRKARLKNNYINNNKKKIENDIIKILYSLKTLLIFYFITT